MSNQKGFANIALIIVIVVIISAVGYFAFVKKSEPVAQQPTPPVTTQTPTPQQPFPTPVNETANWKTYKSDTYSFEVKYPSDWTSKGSWSENGGFFYVAFGTANSIDSKPLVTLRVYPNQTTLDKFIKYFDYVSGTWKNTTLGGVSAKEVVSIGQNSQQFILTASVKNSYGYELASTVFGDNVDTVRKMNSTFQFLSNQLSCALVNGTVGNVLINSQATFGASGGSGIYTWSAPGGRPSSGTGNQFSTVPPTTGIFTVTITSEALSATCDVSVVAP